MSDLSLPPKPRLRLLLDHFAAIEDDRQRIRRSHERPRFTVLDPEEIRRLFGGQETAPRESPAPHPQSNLMAQKGNPPV